MNSADSLHDRASELVEAARAFHAAVDQPTSHAAAPECLASLEETLQVLSAAWYQLAADASPSWPQADGLPREHEVRLVGTLHDVAAAFARCARACRQGRSTVTPLIAQSVHAGRAGAGQRDRELSWFASRPTADRARSGFR